MASAVDICNLALSHLGDAATVSSIDPPEGSVQAEQCKRFYPIARDSLLQSHLWNFNVYRSTLALLTDEMDQWDYIYAWPNNAIDIFTVFNYEKSDDYREPASEIADGVIPVFGAYVPQPYSIETLSDGSRVICTNVEEALARYSVLITDTSKFSPLFVEALGWSLASKLAGPIIRGKEGREEAVRCLQMANLLIGQAAANDSKQRKLDRNSMHLVPWMNGR